MQISTEDIVLVAAMQFHGYPLEHIEKTGSRATFHLKVDEEMLEKFDLGELMVEPNAFSAIIKRLTTSIKRAL